MDNHPERTSPATGGRSSSRFAGLVALAFSLTLNHAAVLADTDSSETVSTAVQGSSEDAEGVVARMIEEWLGEGAGRAFKRKEDLNLVQGTALVALNTSDERWGKARALAFQSAFIEAMGECVSSIRQSTSVSIARDYFEEDVPEAELVYQEGEAPDSYVERIVRKTAVLAEHALDRKLADSGMSEDEIRRLTTPHPLLEEQESVGTVAYWSPAREDAIRKTIGEEAKHASPEKDSQKRKKKTQDSGTAESREPDLADF